MSGSCGFAGGSRGLAVGPGASSLEAWTSPGTQPRGRGCDCPERTLLCWPGPAVRHTYTHARTRTLAHTQACTCTQAQVPKAFPTQPCRKGSQGQWPWELGGPPCTPSLPPPLPEEETAEQCRGAGAALTPGRPSLRPCASSPLPPPRSQPAVSGSQLEGPRLEFAEGFGQQGPVELGFLPGV